MNSSEPTNKAPEINPHDIAGIFYNLVAANPDPLLIVNDQGVILFCNPAGEALLQRSSSDLLGTYFGFPVATHKKIEIQVMHPRGETRTAEMHAAKIIWKGQEAILISLRDISDRIEAENKIRRLSLAIEQAPSAVMITDKEGRIEYVNPMFSKITGYSPDEVIGKTPRILKSGRHPPSYYEKLWESILSGNLWQGEVCNRRKSGEVYWDLQSISPLRNEDGDISHFVSVRIDDTERRRAEERLKVFAEALKRSNKELDEFASFASHELQEPLRKIITFGNRLKARNEYLDEQSRDFLDRMQKVAARMQHQVDDLLQYSKVTTKLITMQKTSLKQVLNDILEEIHDYLKSKGGAIKVADLPDIFAEPMQIRQLFLNLVSNALKYSRKNIPPLIEIESSSVDDKFIQIIVKDNGIGFDNNYSQRIFKAFERLHGKSEYEGTGIGLAICKKIVERHHGTIEAFGKPGEGSVFTVKIPKDLPSSVSL